MPQTFYIDGRHLHDPNGKKIILRGINLPLLDDWDFPLGDKLADLEQTGANAVRIQWYINYPVAGRPAYAIADLDAFLTRCRTNRMIPILGLWDVTCQADATLLNTRLIPWWTSEEVVTVLNKHKQYLIINLANELGFYRWSADRAAALSEFKNAYKSALTSIREKLHMPVMIDAPHCGTSIEALIEIGQELIDHDPDHNLLLSVHAYWADYDGMPHIDDAVNGNLPLVFGEVANKQDELVNDVNQFCFYDLDGLNKNHPPQNAFTYQSLLQTLKTKEIGWLAWSWGPDGCSSRNIGQYNQNSHQYEGLTEPFGNDIVNHPDYGLKNSAERSSIFNSRENVRMKPIQNPPPPSIGPNSSVDAIVNLQDALLLLLEKGRILLSDNERRDLDERLRRDRAAGLYDGGTLQAVRVFRRQSQLGEGDMVDEPTAEALNRLLRELGAFETSQAEWVVRGHVVDADKKGLSGYHVILSEYDLDGITQIKRSISKVDGTFDFGFSFSDILRQGDDTTAPDLVFQIFDPAGAEHAVMSIFTIAGEQETAVPRVAESKQAPIVLTNVPSNLVLRIVVDLQQRPLTEFEQLVARLNPFMRQIRFADLKEDEANFQISFLSKESGAEKTKIEQLREAFQQERESNSVPANSVPAWAFFGIASQKLSLTSVAAMPLDELTSALQPLQPASDQSNLETVAKNLQQFAREHGIQTQITNLKTSVGDLLQPILAADGKLHTFLDAYARHEGDTESFWKAMSQNAAFQEEVPKIQLNLQLSQLTLNNKGLVNALQRKGIENTRQLVDVPAEDWEALALEHKADLPSHITGENDLARAKVYAQELQTLVELAFPTEVIKKSVQQAEVTAFLNHNPAFDFTRTPVETYLHGQGAQALQGIENPEAVKTQLRQMQRMYTLTANAADMNVLMNLRYDSAHQISKLSPEDFTRSLAGKISEENAYLYHAKAVAVSDATAMVYQQLRDLAVSSTPLAAKNLSGDPSALQAIPDWESLFGSLDMCECQHCKSVYSPAAYFVDLLHILLGQNNGAARKEIFRRRPDLRYTKLSCEHTETLIPYIDLVNEVLETYVAQSHVGNEEAKNHAASSTNDTSRFTAADLASNPQHPNLNAAGDAKTAYASLKAATFPLNLPFDMDLETARQFLQEQRSSRFEVMRTFGNAASHATAAERLGISEREFEILTLKKLDGTSEAGIDSTRDLWGSPTIPAGQTLGQLLANVQTFLDSTSMAYTDLIRLLKTRFLNPHFPIAAFLQELSEADRNTWLAAHPAEDQLALLVIALAGDAESPCDLSKTQILHLNGEPLSNEELSRFNRFIRLWKKLGCTIAELDGLLTALGALDLTPQVIQDLSGLWQVKQDLNLSFERAAVLVGNIPTFGKDSLFAKLFLNNAILQIDDKFVLNVAQTELENAAELLEGHVPAILAALQIAEEELNRIAVYTKLTLATDTLTLANLSKIYRYVIFAKGLRIKIKDLMTWLDLIHQLPWGTVADLVKTQELLTKLQRYGFKAADFAYIFQDERAAGTTLPPQDDVINQSAKTLREGLLKIRQENTPKDGSVTAAFLKTELGILLEPEEATKIIGILDETNTQDKFPYLLTPQVSAHYKDILQNYLTTAEVTDLAATTDIPERRRKYWDKIEGKLLPVLRETFIQQHLTATFQAEAALAAFILRNVAVLQSCLDIETDTPAHAQAYAELYILLFKSMWLIEKLQLAGKELSYFQNNANFNSFNWKDFNFAAWLRVADFVALRNSLPPAEKDVLSIFETASKNGDVAKAIIAVTAWDKANVEHFVSKRTPVDFLNEISLTRLQQQIELSRKIGVAIEKLASWANDIVAQEQAQDIKRSLKAKYDETAWVEISTQIHNRLRSQLREALVACLLQKPEIKLLGLKDANALYGYFLIDVEMEACMQTSRLKQAIASVQLFVQRCLLNIESLKDVESQKVFPKQIDAKQWQWMKNYRVWEANRKVFLYPENWIEPELRDNKSPFFKELESELLQGEVTNESAEKALMNYLEKLHDVARLDICGIYEDTEAQELHVFGRTFNTPPQYFYRKLDLKTQVWTAWERVQLDIQGNEEGDSAGVHLIPVVWNRRLYLFWPIFTEKPDKEKIREDKENYKDWKYIEAWAKNEISKKLSKEKRTFNEIDNETDVEAEMKLQVLAGRIESIEEPEESYPWAYYEVRLAWSEYKNKKWSNKKVSQSFIRTPSSSSGVPPTYIYRFELILGSTLKIKLLYQLPLFWLSFLSPIGEYQLICNGKVSVKDSNRTSIEVFNREQSNFYQSYLSFQSLPSLVIKWHTKSSFPLTLQSSNGNNKEILSRSKEEHKVLFSAHDNFSGNSSSRFIYQDHQRNYYVEPRNYSFERVGYLDSEVFQSMRHLEKVKFPQFKRATKIDIVNPKFIEKGDPAPLDRFDRFNDLSASTLNQIVETGQIAASTAMQIRSMQNLAAPASALMEKANLSFQATKIGETYFSRFTTVKLQFKPFFHAFVCKFMETLDKGGIEGLLNLYNQQLDLEVEYLQGDFFPIPIGLITNFKALYGPNEDNVANPYPIDDVDFSPAGAYSLYNWELFFHVPMLLANRLSKNQRFEEAMRWYHFVFNPTTNENLDSSARYWQVIPFRNTPKETLDELFNQLKRRELDDAISAWRNNPFSPHLIARMRLTAYQKTTVMKYLDNLLAWGDVLFRQDTIESINEATQFYILAAELLGKRPEKIPARVKSQALNYAELETLGLDAFSNTLVKLETTFPFYNLQAVQQGVGSAASILNTTVPSLYFCLPNNDKLLGYWDTVADRLFKIRHCQNIEGIERQLALFEPPIDPALLVQAVAGGVDISSVLADLNSPLPHYRFNYIVQKALEICAELKSLGNSCLSALEKKDGEALSMMRTQHETQLLDLAKTVKKLQITEAQRGREGLEKTRAVTEHRANFYTQVLKDGLSSSEKEHQTLGFASMALSVTGQLFEMAASLAHPIPDTSVGAIAGPAGGVTNNNRVAGGDKAAKALSAFGRFFNMLSTMTSFAANSAQTNAGYQRRANDWKLQQDLANKELAQIDKQILAAQIREQIAEKELTNHEQQIENAHQVEDFLRNKYTQEELYGWMIGEISTVYFQCYQLAYDLAKKAEKTYRYELGLPTSNFVQFGVWDSFRKGLLSGERLYLSLKQMEKSYMDQNRREFEITQHISLLLHNPMALIALKETGACILELPEALFDVDYPGHYMRRIKSVSLTIPCVVGPYTSINCTLTLLSSETRVKSTPPAPYAKEADDERFITNFAAMQPIVTSTAQNDSGLFELNFRDERYLPFEGSGAISRWRIELPREFRHFDYDTISDVVLHLKYTAREGGVALRSAAVASMKQLLQDEASKPQSRLFSLRHEFPTEWHRLQNSADNNGDHSQAFSLEKQRFPFVFQGGNITVNSVELFGLPKNSSVPELKLTLAGPDGQPLALTLAAVVGRLGHKTAEAAVEVKNLGDSKKEADWTIKVNKADVAASLNLLEDILVLCHYSVREA